MVERIGVFMGSAVVSALVVGLATGIAIVESIPSDALPYEERYDSRPYQNTMPMVAVPSLWHEHVGDTEYLAFDLAPPYPFSMLRIAVEGADTTPILASAAPPTGVDMRTVLPNTDWAGVVVEVQCAP